MYYVYVFVFKFSTFCSTKTTNVVDCCFSVALLCASLHVAAHYATFSFDQT